MRKLLVIFSLLTGLISLSSCGNQQESKLEQEIEAINQECPINMGMTGDLLSLKYDAKAKEVQVYISVNDEYMNVEELIKQPQIATENVKLSFSQGNPREIAEKIMKAGAGLSITYKSSSSGKKFTVNLSQKDLKDLLDNPLTDLEKNELMLKNKIAIENNNCPKEIEKGIECVRVYDDGDNVIYDFKMDEDLYDISLLKSTKIDHQEVLEDLIKDPVVKNDATTMIELGRGLVYHYYGDKSGKSYDVSFSSEDMKKALD